MASIKDLKRMCKSTDCVNCPLHDIGNSRCSLGVPSKNCPDNADEIVDKWVAEHPAKTYAMDFFEKFPNAPKDSNGVPTACWKYVYGDGKYCASNNACTECWNREMEE